MKVSKLLIVAALILGATTIQAQTAFLFEMKAMFEYNTQTVEVATHHHTFSIDNIDDESVLVLWESSIVGGFYEIERSSGDGEYAAIARMDADGSTSFSFIDNEPGAENTYRLRHISKTGAESYSDENYISLLPMELTIFSLSAER